MGLTVPVCVVGSLALPCCLVEAFPSLWGDKEGTSIDEGTETQRSKVIAYGQKQNTSPLPWASDPFLMQPGSRQLSLEATYLKR